jgi:hypothetical protein
MATRTLTAFLGGPDDPSIANPIHSTEGAAQYGFRGALVPGVILYSWCNRTIVEELGPEWLDSGWASYRCRRPVYPGNEVTITVERQADGTATLTLHNNESDEDSIVGSVGLGESPYLGDFQTTQLLGPAVPQANPRTPMTPENAPVGQDLPPMSVPYHKEEATAYLNDRMRDENPPWTGPDARIPPAWLTGRGTALLHHTYSFAPSIHTSSDIQHLGPARADQDVQVAGRFVNSYERNRQTYAVADLLIRSEQGDPIAKLRHTVIYKVARVD